MDLQKQTQTNPNKQIVSGLENFYGKTGKFYNLHMELDNQGKSQKIAFMRNILASSIGEAVAIFKVELTKQSPDVKYITSDAVCGVVFR